MKYELSIILPCLNEELTLQKTLDDIFKYLSISKIKAEIIVVDNGSTDRSKKIALKNKVRVVEEKKRGYGYALRKGISSACGKYIIMGDADGTYDFEHLDLFVDKLREGYFLVIGNRYLGGFEKGSFSISHYYGVKFLSFIARYKYKVNVGDFHCGLRGFNAKIAQGIVFKSGGMEFATELIKEFSIYGDKVIEIPTILKCGNKNRKPHLRTFRDGFRHLKYIILN